MPKILSQITNTYSTGSLVAISIFLLAFLGFGIACFATLNDASDHMKESHAAYGGISLGIVLITIATLWLVARKHTKTMTMN